MRGTGTPRRRRRRQLHSGRGRADTRDMHPFRSMRNADPFRVLQSATRPLPQRRRFGRLRVQHVTCAGLGRVEDISASGMRVVRPRGQLLRAGSNCELVIRHRDHRIVLQAEVVRAEKQRGRGCVHAFRFCELSESERRNLGQLVREAWDTLTVAAR